MTKQIDTYLDRLFDLLAGGGAEGRQQLAKAEKHLHEAVDTGVAAGLSSDEAASRAIAHFGTPEEVARTRLAVGAGPVISSFGRLFAAAWLFFGVAMSAIGLAGVLSLAALNIGGPDAVVAGSPDRVYSPARCAEFMRLAPEAQDCAAAALIHHVDARTTRAIAMGAMGLALLAAFFAAQRLARRWPVLRMAITLPSRSMVCAVGAVGFGLPAIASLIGLAIDVTTGETAGLGGNLAQSAAALVAFAIFFPCAWRQLSLGQS